MRTISHPERRDKLNSIIRQWPVKLKNEIIAVIADIACGDAVDGEEIRHRLRTVCGHQGRCECGTFIVMLAAGVN